jgi:hypothetical protein
MIDSENQPVLLCPRCCDYAEAAAIDFDGTVILWQCRNCFFQGDQGDFIELADDFFPECDGDTEI